MATMASDHSRQPKCRAPIGDRLADDPSPLVSTTVGTVIPRVEGDNFADAVQGREEVLVGKLAEVPAVLVDALKVRNVTPDSDLDEPAGTDDAMDLPERELEIGFSEVHQRAHGPAGVKRCASERKVCRRRDHRIQTERAAVFDRGWRHIDSDVGETLLGDDLTITTCACSDLQNRPNMRIGAVSDERRQPSCALFTQRSCRAVGDLVAVELNQPLHPSALDRHRSNLGAASQHRSVAASRVTIADPSPPSPANCYPEDHSAIGTVANFTTVPLIVVCMDSLRDRVLARLSVVSPGASQNELARRVGMSPSALSRALNKERGLTGDELVSIARELQSSVDWILTGHEPFPIRVAARHRFSEEHGHHMTRAAAAERATLEDIALAYQQATDLVPIETRPVPADPVEARAALVETCGEDWPRFFADAIERTFGIDVVKVDLPDGDGYSMSLPTGTVVVVPTAAFWGRQNWTIAHELGHIARDEFTRIEESIDASSERHANDFAARLLLPEDVVRAEDWADMPPAVLAEFLWRTGVSLDALGHRLATLGLPRVQPELNSAQLVRRYPPVTVRVFDDPITDRFRAAAARRFPTRLLAAHEGSQQFRRTLAWMLGVSADQDDGTAGYADLDEMAEIFGVSASS